MSFMLFFYKINNDKNILKEVFYKSILKSLLQLSKELFDIYIASTLN